MSIGGVGPEEPMDNEHGPDCYRAMRRQAGLDAAAGPEGLDLDGMERHARENGDDLAPFADDLLAECRRLRAEMAGLRDERDALRFEVERLTTDGRLLQSIIDSHQRRIDAARAEAAAAVAATETLRTEVAELRPLRGEVERLTAGRDRLLGMLTVIEADVRSGHAIIHSDTRTHIQAALRGEGER